MSEYVDELTLRNRIAGAVAARNHTIWRGHVDALADHLEAIGRTEDAFLVRVSPFPHHKSSNWPDVLTVPNGLDSGEPIISQHQQEMLAIATARQVGILGGSPGTGKTRVAMFLACEIKRSGQRVAICAPTGKAAVRAREQFDHVCSIHPGLQGVHHEAGATTIHSMLKVKTAGYDGNGWVFQFDEKNQMSCDFFIVEEASMLDLALANSLLSAIRSGAHVLFVGDLGQLPPVGHGSPLRDMIQGGVPYGELTKIRRNAGRIVSTCAAIRRGGEIVPSEVFDQAAGENYRHFEEFKPEKAVENILGILGNFRDGGKTNFNPVSDVQVLSAVNDNGVLARHKLNPILQDFLNPKGHRVEKNKYRVGDKIICTRNGRYANAFGPGLDGEEDSYVANGEIGTVIDLDKISTTATFGSGDRLASVRIAGDDRDHFDLGWCITAHKSQGSEWPVVIIPIDSSPAANQVCGCEWWYTAMSRAKILSITVGRLGTMQLQAKRAVLPRRKTFLAERIRSELMKEVAEAAMSQ